MKKRGESYILWLPSWYPNKLQPYDGDFIQRHAKAASLYNKIILISFPQYGEHRNIQYDIEEKRLGKLQELIVYIPFKPWQVPLLDRVRYNLTYYLFARKFLKRFFRQNGLPEIVHVHVPMKAGNLALWIKRKFSIPFILSEQASTYLETASDNFFKRNLIYKIQVRKIFREASYVTNVSKNVGNILKTLFSIKKLAVIHNVVDTAIFYSGSLKFESFTYIHVSSLTDQKNITGIVRTFSVLSKIRTDWKLLLVGLYTEDILHDIEKSGLNERVTLTGEIPYQEVASYLRQSHAFVLFSKHENFPCVIVEALSCGLPVVSSDVAGINEAVNATNGILVESENEDALLNALLQIREKYSTYNAAEIAADAEKSFSYPVIANKFDELYVALNVRRGIGNRNF